MVNAKITMVAGFAALASDVNSNFNGTIIHRKFFSLPTEFTTDTPLTYQNVTNGSFFIGTSGGVLLGMSIRADMLTTAAGAAHLQILISGTNLGQKYITRAAGYDNNGYIDTLGALAVTGSSAESYNWPIFLTRGTAYTLHADTMFYPLKFADDNTYFQIQVKQAVTANTISVSGIEIISAYTQDYTEDS